MSDRPASSRSVLRPGPVFAAWALTLGIDLCFNAWVFSPLFDQAREPNLLADEVLFRRIPVAYAALLIACAGIGWLVHRLRLQGVRRGAVIGAGLGIVLAAMGVVSLWTAIDMTGEFVGAAVIVQVVEMSAAGAVLGAWAAAADGRRIARRALGLAVGLAVLGIVVQNLI